MDDGGGNDRSDTPWCGATISSIVFVVWSDRQANRTGQEEDDRKNSTSYLSLSSFRVLLPGGSLKCFPETRFSSGHLFHSPGPGRVYSPANIILSILGDRPSIVLVHHIQPSVHPAVAWHMRTRKTATQMSYLDSHTSN